MHVDDDLLYLSYNGYGAMTDLPCGLLTDGAHEITLEVEALAGSRANVEVTVDGRFAASAEDLPLLMAMAPFQGIDVGIDRGSPVSWARYERNRCGRYVGSLHEVSWTGGAASPEDPLKFADLLREMYQKYE